MEAEKDKQESKIGKPVTKYQLWTEQLNWNYSTTLNFAVVPLDEVDHVTLWCLSSAGPYQRIVPVCGNFSLESVVQ